MRKVLAIASTVVALCAALTGPALADATCRTGILLSSSDSGLLQTIEGYFGQGYVAVSFQNAGGPPPVAVSIVDVSGLGPKYPNQTPSETSINPNSSYTFGYWGGLNNGGTRRYTFKVRALTPFVSGVRVPYQVISNRC